MPKIKTSIRSSLVKRINDSAKKNNSPLRGKLDGAIKRVSDEAANLSSVVDGIAITESEFGEILNRLSKESMSRLMEDFFRQLPAQGLSKQSLAANAEDITTIQATLLRLEQMLKEGDTPEGVEARKEDALLDDRLKNLKELQQEIDRGAHSDEARIGEYLRREKRYRAMQTQRGGKSKTIGEGGTLPAALYDTGKNKLTQFAQKQGIFKDLNSVNQGIFGHASILTAPLFKAAGWAVNSGISGVLDPKHSLLGRMGTSLKDKLTGDRKKDEEKEDFKELAITQTTTLEDIKNLLQYQGKKKGGIVLSDKDKKEDASSILPWILGIGAVAIGATVYKYFTDPKFKTWLDDNVLKPVYTWVSDKWDNTVKPWLSELFDSLGDTILDSWAKRKDREDLSVLESAAYGAVDVLTGGALSDRNKEQKQESSVNYRNSAEESARLLNPSAPYITGSQVSGMQKRGDASYRGPAFTLPAKYNADYIKWNSDESTVREYGRKISGADTRSDYATVIDKQTQLDFWAKMQDHSAQGYWQPFWMKHLTDENLGNQLSSQPLKGITKSGAEFLALGDGAQLADISWLFSDDKGDWADTSDKLLRFARGESVEIRGGNILDASGTFVTDKNGKKIPLSEAQLGEVSLKGGKHFIPGTNIKDVASVADAYALRVEDLGREDKLTIPKASSTGPLHSNYGAPPTLQTDAALSQFAGKQIPLNPTSNNNVTYITYIKGNDQDQGVE